MGEVRDFGRIAGATAAIITLALFAAPAAAAVTIGQIGTPSGAICGFQIDSVQPMVSSGLTYVVPGTDGDTSWTVTSWSTMATGPSEMTMKFFRKISEPNGYLAVAHDGPRMLTNGGTAANTFPSDLVVRTGDVLGLFTATTDSCRATSTDSFLFTGAGGPTGLQDEQAADFTVGTNARLQIQATLEPSNRFDIGTEARNKKRGTATIPLNLPNPGAVTAAGRFASAAGARSSKSVSAGPARLLVRATGKKKRKLNERGVVKLPITITYTPSGGSPHSELIPLALKKKVAARAAP